MLTIYINWLVVSQFQPLWKIWKSVGVIIPNIWNTTKCSKPPTSLEFIYSFSIVQEFTV